MKISTANGMLRLDSGASIKDYAHDKAASQIKVEQIGNYIALRQGPERIMQATIYTSLFQSDGVTPLGASAALTVTAIEALL